MQGWSYLGQEHLAKPKLYSPLTQKILNTKILIIFYLGKFRSLGLLCCNIEKSDNSPEGIFRFFLCYNLFTCFYATAAY